MESLLEKIVPLIQIEELKTIIEKNKSDLLNTKSDAELALKLFTLTGIFARSWFNAFKGEYEELEGFLKIYDLSWKGTLKLPMIYNWNIAAFSYFIIFFNYTVVSIEYNSLESQALVVVKKKGEPSNVYSLELEDFLAMPSAIIKILRDEKIKYPDLFIKIFLNIFDKWLNKMGGGSE